MSIAGLPEPERDLFLDALVSYADACTLPLLTPSCPYYRDGADGPTCGMECRELAERHGAGRREIREETLLGLVLTGVALPARAVAGAQQYDARQLFVVEHDLEPAQQSTSTLLLGLKASVERSISQGLPPRNDRALAVWQELATRGVEVERVLRGALLPHMTTAIGFHALFPGMVRARDVFLGDDDDLELLAKESEGSGWSAVLKALSDTYPTDTARDWAASQRYPHLSSVLAQMSERAPWEQQTDTAARPHIITSNPELLLALSKDFLVRVEEWLFRLLDEDVYGFLETKAPPPPLLAGFSSVFRPLRDEIGLWIWERFTLTHLDEWSDSSLMLEWRSHQGDAAGSCPDRILAERRTSPDAVTHLALERASKRRGRSMRNAGLEASAFVSHAVGLLGNGQYREAANLFTALLQLRPGDGEALNNYGFCILPVESAAALVAFQQASLFEWDSSPVNVANQVLSLHLEGRNFEAEELGKHLLASGDGDNHTGWLWHHEPKSNDYSLIQENVRDYVSALLEHIAGATDCTLQDPSRTP